MSTKLSPLEIQKLIQDVKKIEERVDNDFSSIFQKNKNLEDKVIVFLLGFTGTGKTTLYYALTEKELKVIKDRRILRLEAVTPEDNLPIMNGQCSYLDSPVLKYDEKTDIIFCDCPCFSDDRGSIQDIKNSFAISRALSHAKKSKILLLITSNDVDSAKGKAVRDSCEIVENLIQNQEYLKSNVGLIISNVKPEYCNELFLNEIETNCHLLENLIMRESGEHKLVFTFPTPTREMVDNTYTGFENKNHILDFIHDCQPSNLSPRISLSLESKLTISKSVDSFGSLPNLLQQLIDQIQYEYSLSDDDLDAWKERIEKLCQCQVSLPREFVDQAKKILPPGSKYEEIYNNILNIDKWRSFLERICPEDESEDHLLSRHSQAMSSIYLDIPQFLNERLTPSLEIINNKIRMKEHREEEDIEIQALKNEIKDKQEKSQQLADEINNINKNGDELEKRLKNTDKEYEKEKKSYENHKNQHFESNQQSQNEKNKTGSCLLI